MKLLILGEGINGKWLSGPNKKNRSAVEQANDAVDNLTSFKWRFCGYVMRLSNGNWNRNL